MTFVTDAPPLRKKIRRPALAAVAAFVAVFALAGAVAVFVAHQWQSAAEQRFGRRAAALRESIGLSLVANEAVLRSARAHLAQTPLPDAASWARYVSALDLDGSHTAVVALGYVPGEHDESGVAFWAGPAARSGNLPVRPDAVRSIRPDDIVLAVAAPSPTSVTPLTLWLPVDDRSAAHGNESRNPFGFAVAALDVQRLFEPLLAAQPGLEITLSTNHPPFELYRSAPLEGDEVLSYQRFERTDRLFAGGTALTIETRADGSPLLTGAATSAAAILMVGALVAAACAWLAFRLVAVRLTPSVSISDARLNEARMMAIIRSSMEAIITVDEFQKVVIFNPAAEYVFGVSAMEAIGSPLSRFLPERFRAAHAQHVDQFGVTGVTERQMGHQQRVLLGLRANGEEFPIEASISQIKEASGKLYTVMLRDITERLRAENTLKRSREELRELSANLQSVREAEKTRIARELHDDLGQQLTALKIDLSSLGQRLGPDVAPDITSSLAGMSKLIDATVRGVRRIAADLRPVMLDDLGLESAIDWLANDFTSRYGIRVRKRLETGKVVFSSAAASTLFRIVQEALTNVARHAQANKVDLSLEADAQHCILRIADNGCGATGERSDALHRTQQDKTFGLLGIRERAHMFNGVVEIDTAPGEGFSLSITFDLDALQTDETTS
ncbi:PAS domain S-box-containing protein [Paraburkholderia bannensis]|uniref:PAS domain S-box-containing protein n=1 Tax=Paraburkholderia bannensis TaxID=765414 RepID=A0A7W9U6W0_9BURK|nr:MULTISPECIES: PAS domain-containing sensor histidine kinase [Paraburkholderia]MBB3262106.1 PAS domain S-box-containing protein [Paraburkholderia sp. WP4_3_2]MBB6107095.1 PAS domain S-box-containing protein [Paraburkholderia bannensis]